MLALAVKVVGECGHHGRALGIDEHTKGGKKRMKRVLIVLSLLLAIFVLSTAGAKFNTPSSCGRTACHMMRDAQAEGTLPFTTDPPSNEICYINGGTGVVRGDLKLKSFRRDTPLGIEMAINEWLKENPEATIYHIQHITKSIGGTAAYIWYRPLIRKGG